LSGTHQHADDGLVLGEGEQAVKWKDAMVRGISVETDGEPEDYAGIVAFLASDDAVFITGQTFSGRGRNEHI